MPTRQPRFQPGPCSEGLGRKYQEHHHDKIFAGHLSNALASRACGSTVNLTWSYDYTGLSVCSATVTKNCMDHFEMHDATSGTPVLIAAVQNPLNAKRKGDSHHRNISNFDSGAKDVRGDSGRPGQHGQPCLQRLDEVPGDISSAPSPPGIFRVLCIAVTCPSRLFTCRLF